MSVQIDEQITRSAASAEANVDVCHLHKAAVSEISDPVTIGHTPKSIYRQWHQLLIDDTIMECSCLL